VLLMVERSRRTPDTQVDTTVARGAISRAQPQQRNTFLIPPRLFSEDNLGLAMFYLLHTSVNVKLRIPPVLKFPYAASGGPSATRRSRRTLFA
jgi:hypothetical protein